MLWEKGKSCQKIQNNQRKWDFKVFPGIGHISNFADYFFLQMTILKIVCRNSTISHLIIKVDPKYWSYMSVTYMSVTGIKMLPLILYLYLYPVLLKSLLGQSPVNFIDIVPQSTLFQFISERERPVLLWIPDAGVCNSWFSLLNLLSFNTYQIT